MLPLIRGPDWDVVLCWTCKAVMICQYFLCPACPFLFIISGDKSYIYVSGGNGDKGKIARISSRAIDGRSSEHCLEFDYYLPKNSSSSKLTIAVQRNDGNQVNIMTLVVDEDNDDWRHQTKTLSKADVGEKFQVSNIYGGSIKLL